MFVLFCTLTLSCADVYSSRLAVPIDNADYLSSILLPCLYWGALCIRVPVVMCTPVLHFPHMAGPCYRGHGPFFFLEKLCGAMN